MPDTPTTRRHHDRRRSSSPAPHQARRPRRALGLGLALALLAACGSDGDATDRATTDATTEPTASTATDTATTEALGDLPAAVQVLDIEGSEYAFDIRTGSGAPTSEAALVPGWTEVTFRNEGIEAHQVMFASLKEGVDLAQLAEAAGGDSSGSKAIEYVDMLGGVSYIGPGQTIEAMVDLPEGVVMAMCYVPDPDGVAHALSGMSSVLNVGPAADATGGGTSASTDTAPVTSDGADGDDADTVGQSADDPDGGDPEAVQGTIVMEADGYQIPSPLPAGWYEVVNRDGGDAGEGLHELSILGLDEELDADGLEQLLGDLAANNTPAVALDALGGMGALSGGFTGYLYLDLAPGPYLAVDFMPDPGDPRPHLLDGYVTAFRP